jgi:hypothetical protein
VAFRGVFTKRARTSLPSGVNVVRRLVPGRAGVRMLLTASTVTALRVWTAFRSRNT